MSSFNELKAAFENETKALGEAVEAVSKAVEVKDGKVAIPEQGYAEVTRLKKNINELKDLMSAGSELKDLEKWAAEGGESAARYAQPMVEQKSIADLVLESPEYKQMLESGRDYMTDDVEVNFANITAGGTKDLYGQVGSSSSAMINPGNDGIGANRQRLGLISPLRLTTRVRDLFPQASTQNNLIEYFKMTDLNPNGAATVAERRAADGTSAPTGGATDVFGLKPKSNFSFTYASDPVKLVAHWIAVHRNTLADVAQMRSFIDDNLMYGLALAEDDQLLNGGGTGEDLVGILNRPGIQTFAGVGTDQMTDQVRRALTLVELAYLPSNGLVVHPRDWEKLELQKADVNGNYMLTLNIATGAQKRLWQVPVVSTPAITEGTFLTGAFGQAVQIFDRERANIRVGDQHADFFARNAVAVLAEERLALTVTRPQGIVSGTFADYTGPTTP